MSVYDLTGFELRRLAENDLAMLHEWLLRPHIAEWWGAAESVEELRADYLEQAEAENATEAFIAYYQNAPIGFIQCYVVMGSGDGWWEEETDPGARGIDQFLANPEQLNAGLGRAMIRAFIAKIFADPEVTVIQTDPNPNNLRAIRCYTAAGFQAVGEVMTPDGLALLMCCNREPFTQFKQE